MTSTGNTGNKYFCLEKSSIPLLIPQQMGCLGRATQRKLRAESTPSSCETHAKKLNYFGKFSVRQI